MAEQKENTMDLKSKQQIQDMTEEQLNIYEHELVQKLHFIHFHQQQLSKQKEKCIVCKKNERNVVLNGCKHLVICFECENKSKSNLCPSCFTEYNEIFIINL